MEKILDEEIHREWERCNPIDEGMGVESAYIHIEAFDMIAHHFCNLGRKIERTLIGAQILQAQKDSLIWEDVEKILECFYAVNKDMREGSLDHIRYGSTEYYEEILRRFQGR